MVKSDLTHLGSHLAASCRSSMRTEFWIAPEDLQAGTAAREVQRRQLNRSAPPPDRNQPFRLPVSGSRETPKKRLLHSVDLPSLHLFRPRGILIKCVWQLATRLLHNSIELNKPESSRSGHVRFTHRRESIEKQSSAATQVYKSTRAQREAQNMDSVKI
jgi:hypothetical protein